MNKKHKDFSPKVILLILLLTTFNLKISAQTCPSFTPIVSFEQTQVSTFAGSGTAGFAPGTGTGAQLNFPNSLSIDDFGNMYATTGTASANGVQKITPAGVVTLLAGGNSTNGNTDGIGPAAYFNYPRGSAVDNANQFLYLADEGNHRIRKIDISTGAVTTYFGSGIGSADGPLGSATTTSPVSIVITPSGDMYFVELQNLKNIRKISGGMVSTITSGSPFVYPNNLVMDPCGNMIVAQGPFQNCFNFVTPGGVVTNFSGICDNTYGYVDGNKTIARYGNPNGMVMDEGGNIYVCDKQNCLIRKITPNGTASTLAGNGFGYSDGIGTAAKFSEPSGIVLDAAGNLFVADVNNHRIRKLTVPPIPALTTCAGTASAPQSFKISCASLIANAIITPPIGYEVSLTAGSGYASAITLTPTSGEITSTTIYIRLAAASPAGTYVGNITLSSTGATNKTLAISGTINPVTTPTITAPTSVCQGSPITFSTPTALSYTWTGPNGFTSNLQNPSIGVSTLLMSGNYSLSVVDLGGCTSPTAIKTVTVNAVPTAPTAANPIYCQGDAATPLIASGTGILWYTVSTGGTGSGIAPTPSTAVAGTFLHYVSQTVSGCESPRTTVAVTISSPINANAGADYTTTSTNLTMAGNNPSPFTGNWSVLSGTGSFTSPSLFNTTLTGASLGFNQYIWTVNGGPCPTTKDTIKVNVLPNTSACDAVTPTYLADISTNANGFWDSPLILKNGLCCAAINPEKCLNFIMNFEPTAMGYSLNITSGALPAGSLFYQTNCGAIFVMGDTTCITGPAPYSLTFCKPGNNSNTYRINSIKVEAAGTITGPNNVCANQTGVTYSIAPVVGASNYTWSLPPGATITAGANTTSITVTFGLSSGSVSVTPSNKCGSGTSSSLPITVAGCQTITTSAISATTFCAGNSVNVPFTISGVYNPGNVFTAELSNDTGSFVTPIAIGTLTSTTAGTITATIPLAQTAGAQYKIRVVSNNPSIIGTTNGANITINAQPVVTSIAYSSTTICSSAGSQTVTLTGSTGGSYSASAGLSINTTTGIVDPSTSSIGGPYTITYTIPAAGGCTVASASTNMTIIAQPTATSIAYPSSTICTSTGPQNVTLTGSAGGTYSSAIGLTINGTTGTIDPSTSIGGPYTINYDIPAIGGCTPVNVSTSITITTTPTAPILNTGTSPVCSGINGNAYSVVNDPMVTYTWNYTGTGHTINGTTNAITIDFALGATSGDVTVTANNSCGASSPLNFPVTVNAAPATPGAINGPKTVCENTTGNLYDITSVSSAAFYNWTYTGTGQTISGGTTNAISVNFGIGATSGNLAVTAHNSCGASAPSSVPITIKPALNNLLNIFPLKDTICFKENTTVSIEGTEVGVTYKAFRAGTTPIGTPIVGNGATLSIPITYAELLSPGNKVTIEASLAGCATVTFVKADSIYRSDLSIAPTVVSDVPSLCAPGAATLSVPNSYFKYDWFFNATPSVVGASNWINANSNSAIANFPGNYFVKVFDALKCGIPSSIISLDYGTTQPTIAAAGTSATSTNLTGTTSNALYQWYIENAAGKLKKIEGATTQNFTAYFDGNYYLGAPFNNCYLYSNVHTVGGMAAGSILKQNFFETDSSIVIPDLNAIAEVALSPNPSDGIFQIQYLNLSDSPTTVSIFSTYGKLITDEQIVKRGVNTLTFELHDLPEGIYYVEVNQYQTKFIQKLIIQK